MIDRDARAADGRRLRIAEDGDPQGTPVLMLGGTPGSRLIPARDAERARGHGVRLIAYDRPGYGESSRLEGRNVADCAADVRTIADALGIDRLAVAGGSGGGPHALACAALLDGLVPAVASLCSPAPVASPGLDWLAGMGEGNLAEFGAVREGPGAGRAFLSEMREGMIGADVAAMLAEVTSLLSPVDAEALTGEVAQGLLDSFRVGLADGVDGWLDDDLALLGDWGFGLSQIRTPVLLMHGEQDRFVPVAHGRWLAEAIPGAQSRILEAEGHISLTENQLDATYDWLLARMG